MKTYAKDVRVQAPDRPRPVRRRSTQRARPGPDLVLRPGVPAGRRHRSSGSAPPSCRRAHPPRGVFGDGSARKTVTETEAPETGHATRARSSCRTPASIHVPVDIELKFADGSTQRLRWDDRGTGTLGAVRRRAQLAARRGHRSIPTARSRSTMPTRAPLSARRRWRRRRCAPARGSRRGRRPSCRSWGPERWRAPRASASCSAPGRARSSRYTGTLLAVFVVQSLIAARVHARGRGRARADVRAPADVRRGRRRRSRRARSGAVRYGKPSLLAIGGIVFGAVAALAARVVVPRRRPLRRARAAPRGPRRHRALLRRERRDHVPHVRAARAVLAARLVARAVRCSAPA